MGQYEKLQNLMVMAAADGSLTEREIKFLSDRCRQWGFSDVEFAAAIRYALTPAAKVEIPASHSARQELLRDLIRMMAADGNLADDEKRLFATVAAQMGLESNELNAIIDEVLGGA